MNRKTNRDRRGAVATIVLFFGILALALLTGCRGKDPYAFSIRDVDQHLNPIGQDYSWTFIQSGWFLNGHGMPDHYVSYVLVHQPSSGPSELIWPEFPIRNDIDAAVQDGVLIFNGRLPDRRKALMIHRPGSPPFVVAAAALRLAAQRLGRTILEPGVDYVFAKVRSAPGRVWLEGERQTDFGQARSNAKTFNLELTPDDIDWLIIETTKRGTLKEEQKFKYTIEPGSCSRITEDDFAKTEAPRPSKPRPVSRYFPTNPVLAHNVLVDPINHFAYFNTHHEPAEILKVAIGATAETPLCLVGAVLLEPKENQAFCGDIDPQSGYAYYGTRSPALIVKIALGQGREPPRRVGAIPLPSAYGTEVGVLDSASGYGCFAARGTLYKVRLGAGDELPTIVSSLELPGVPTLNSAVLDPTTHSIYFGSDARSIYKIEMGEKDAPVTFVGELVLPQGEHDLRGALIDPAAGCAWFASTHGSVIKVALGAPGKPPERVTALKLDHRYRYLMHTFGQDTAGYGYFACMSSQDADAGLLKISLGRGSAPPQLVSGVAFPTNVCDIVTGVVDANSGILCLGLARGEHYLAKYKLGQADSQPIGLSSSPLKP